LLQGYLAEYGSQQEERLGPTKFMREKLSKGGSSGCRNQKRREVDGRDDGLRQTTHRFPSQDERGLVWKRGGGGVESVRGTGEKCNKTGEQRPFLLGVRPASAG